MIEQLKRLIEALRHELTQYGEMLALLDQQQDVVVRRNADEILSGVAAINAQSAVIHNARRQREINQQQLARSLRRSDDCPFRDLLLLLPEDYRPLVQALVEENNELLLRVQQRARQNHLLLSRSVDLMHRFLSTLFPAGRTTVYNAEGAVFAPVLPQRSLYEAIG